MYPTILSSSSPTIFCCHCCIFQNLLPKLLLIADVQWYFCKMLRASSFLFVPGKVNFTDVLLFQSDTLSYLLNF